MQDALHGLLLSGVFTDMMYMLGVVLRVSCIRPPKKKSSPTNPCSILGPPGIRQTRLGFKVYPSSLLRVLSCAPLNYC